MSEKNKEERLQKVMAHAGIASRRRCEELITQGRVKVNGKVVTELGSKVDPLEDEVEFDGHPIPKQNRNVYLLLYKPTQVISSVHDPKGRTTVVDFIPEDFGRVYPVGRLDWDSEGAILMTNDGKLTELLTHPRHEVPKVYAVKLKGIWKNDDSRIHKLRHGITLDDGHKTLPAEIIKDDTTKKHTWFIMAIKEGKNRQIRRMFSEVGIDVLKLKRLAYGPVLLGDMRPAEYRRLTEKEIDELYEAAGKERPDLKASRGRLPKHRRESSYRRRLAAQRDIDPEEQPS
jgi:pseudouridine synthase